MGISALAAAVPVLLNTSALTMPCREMCEAVISTCSCSRDYRSALQNTALMSLYHSPMIQSLILILSCRRESARSHIYVHVLG